MRQQMLFNSVQDIATNTALQFPGVNDDYDYDHACNDVCDTGNEFITDAIELVSAQRGLDELKILMPLMKSITSKGKRILLIAPPSVAFAPYLVSFGVDIRMLDVVQSDSSCVEVIQLIEQALRDDEHAMLVTWLDWLPNSVVKRIQLATNASKKIFILFKQYEHQNSPLNMQIKVQFNDQNSVKGVRFTLMSQQKLHTQYDSGYDSGYDSPGFDKQVDAYPSPVVYLDSCLALV